MVFPPDRAKRRGLLFSSHRPQIFFSQANARTISRAMRSVSWMREREPSHTGSGSESARCAISPIERKESFPARKRETAASLAPLTAQGHSRPAWPPRPLRRGSKRLGGRAARRSASPRQRGRAASRGWASGRGRSAHIEWEIRISAVPSWAITAPSANSTAEWMMLCRCT